MLDGKTAGSYSLLHRGLLNRPRPWTPGNFARFVQELTVNDRFNVLMGAWWSTANETISADSPPKLASVPFTGCTEKTPSRAAEIFADVEQDELAVALTHHPAQKARSGRRRLSAISPDPLDR